MAEPALKQKQNRSRTGHRTQTSHHATPALKYTPNEVRLGSAVRQRSTETEAGATGHGWVIVRASQNIGHSTRHREGEYVTHGDVRMRMDQRPLFQRPRHTKVAELRRVLALGPLGRGGAPLVVAYGLSITTA